VFLFTELKKGEEANDMPGFSNREEEEMEEKRKK
jgi:hypothetical protein